MTNVIFKGRFIMNCPKCYGEVDERATFCPHCSQRIKTKPNERIGNYILFLALVLGLMAYFLGGFLLAILVFLVVGIAGAVIKRTG